MVTSDEEYHGVWTGHRWKQHGASGDKWIVEGAEVEVTGRGPHID